jgi:hypothetical protein
VSHLARTAAEHDAVGDQGSGYRQDVTTPRDERPVELEDVPREEGISTEDAQERADIDPEDQPNRTDPVQGTGTGDPDQY